MSEEQGFISQIVGIRLMIQFFSLLVFASMIFILNHTLRFCYEEGCPKEDPLSQESFRKLAEPLPFSKQHHSKLVCYITREVMDSENPPLVLPNGYVYSTKALEEMAKKNNGNITCPRTGYVCSYTDLVKAYIS